MSGRLGSVVGSVNIVVGRAVNSCYVGSVGSVSASLTLYQEEEESCRSRHAGGEH